MHSDQKIKYIVYEGDLNDTCVIFPNWVSHLDMATTLGALVLGAGFVDIEVNSDGHVEFTAHGKSQSLGIESRLEDTLLLNKQFAQ